MITLEQCITSLAALPDGPDFLTSVDNEVVAYLLPLRGDLAAVARERKALFDALQRASDFPTRGRILDRLAGIEANQG